MNDLIKKFAHMLKDQRGYTPEQFEDIITAIVEELQKETKDADSTGL